MTFLVLSKALRRVLTALKAFGDQFRLLVEGVEEARAKADLFQRLTRLSDAELATRGLKRADIARAVFTSAHRA